MARKSVKSFAVTNNGNSITVEIQTENKKPHIYEITPDEVQPNANEIAQHLNAGLNQALTECKKIEISEFPERFYVTIVTPIKRHSNRYTARKL